MANEYVTTEMLSEQYLLRKNQIYIFGVIETGMAARVIPQMHYIEQRMIEENIPKEERILTMLINSPGGSVADGLAIYDTMNALACEVRTICVGLAASMGAFLLSSGSRGMRLALPYYLMTVTSVPTTVVKASTMASEVTPYSGFSMTKKARSPQTTACFSVASTQTHLRVSMLLLISWPTA